MLHSLGAGVRAAFLSQRARRQRFAWPVTLTTPAVASRGLAGGAETVALRAIRRTDAQAWYALRLADAARLSPWEATLPAGSPETLRSFSTYAHEQNRLAHRGMAMPFIVEVDGALAGQVTAAPIHWDALSSASVGYWIGSHWEGRGVMALSVAMVLDHLLGPEVGLHRVEINVRPENARSLALCRRLGLREEGLRRGLMNIDGAWADHLSFAVVAEEVADGPGFVQRLRRM